MDKFEDFGVPDQKDEKIPRWLILTYIILPLWGFVWFFYFFNGSVGFFDRGYWAPLQKAAKTTYPFEKKINYDIQ